MNLAEALYTAVVAVPLLVALGACGGDDGPEGTTSGSGGSGGDATTSSTSTSSSSETTSTSTGSGGGQCEWPESAPPSQVSFVLHNQSADTLVIADPSSGQIETGAVDGIAVNSSCAEYVCEHAEQGFCINEGCEVAPGTVSPGEAKTVIWDGRLPKTFAIESGCRADCPGEEVAQCETRVAATPGEKTFTAQLQVEGSQATKSVTKTFTFPPPNGVVDIDVE